MSDVSKWFDRDGACKICEGEIPYGHDLNCFIYQKELEIKELEQQLSNSTPNAAIRKLIKELESKLTGDGYYDVTTTISIRALNKLLEGDNDE